MLPPRRSPPQSSSVCWIFPSKFLNQGVCSSNFPILQILPSLGLSSRTHRSLENGCLFCPACLDLESLGPVPHPYHVQRECRGPTRLKCQEPVERAEDWCPLSRALETQKVEISIPLSKLQTAAAPWDLETNDLSTSGPISIY